jgi:hypothetical protein
MEAGCASGFYLEPGYITAESYAFVRAAVSRAVHLSGGLAIVGERGPELDLTTVRRWSQVRRSE